MRSSKKVDGEPPEGLDRGLGAFDDGDPWLLQHRQLLDRAHHAAQRRLQLRVGAGQGAAAPVRESRLFRPLAEVGADLLQLRVAAKGVEASRREVELAPQLAQKFVAVCRSADR